MTPIRRAAGGWHWQALKLASGFCLICVALIRGDAPAQALYTQNFEQLAEDKPPEEFLVLAGNFHIKSTENNKVLIADPDPLDAFGLLFGPADVATYAVSARIRASNTGKRFPEFGIGALGPGGYKLWLMPATNQLQLKKADQLLTHVPYDWKSGSWTHLKLRLSKTGGNKMQLQGKAWSAGAKEPEAWNITATDESDPPKPGKASIWTTPYSGTPTYFDDLSVNR